jgi:GNAT superfamily N-acetyltransferase
VSVRFEPLGARPDLIRTTVGWHLAEFDPGGDAAFWLRHRAREATDGGVPSAWIAMVGSTPVGTVSLTNANMDTHPEKGPWLAALYVRAPYRHRGVGSALVRRCEDEARRSGAERMYLYTERVAARSLYERLGWTTLAIESYEGLPVWLMVRVLA